MTWKCMLCAAAVVSAAGCRTIHARSESETEAALDQPARDDAFKAVKPRLDAIRANLRSIKVEDVDVNKATVAEVAAIVGTQNRDPAEQNPPSLRGVFWMRGNPLPDYLLSFSNTKFAQAAGTWYGYMPTFYPGSFSWKKQGPAVGSTDPTFVPPVCRVPDKDPTLMALAKLAATHDRVHFADPVDKDLEALEPPPPGAPAKTPILAAPGQPEAFLDFIQKTPQRDEDGGKSVMDLFGSQMYYEAGFGKNFTTGDVQVFPLQGHGGGFAATFSFAPLPGHPDVYLRKSWVEPAGKAYPNYYFLTRIFDENGTPIQPNYDQFIDCVKQRSGGHIYKVVPGP